MPLSHLELKKHNGWCTSSHVPVPLFVDNSGVIALVFNPIDHQANKHIRLACHFARELTEEKLIAPQRVPSANNLADVFTKALGGTLFKELVQNFIRQSKAPMVTSVRGGVLDSAQ